MSKSKSEEVSDIIARMPTKFSGIITLLICSIFISMLLLGWFIKYPDVITGDITINSINAPVKIVSPSNGNIIILKKNSELIREKNEYVAYIQNSSDIKDMMTISNLIHKITPSKIINPDSLSYFSNEFSLGELNPDYFAFINAKDQLLSNREKNLYSKQEKLTINDIGRAKNDALYYQKKLRLLESNIHIQEKMVARDSLLFMKKYESAAEYEKSKINLMTVQNEYQSLLKEYNAISQTNEDLENRLQQTGIQKNEKERQNQLDVITQYTNLIEKFRLWELKYVFKSPIIGTVQYMSFLKNNDFVQAGQPAFNIVPAKGKIIGQMHLTAKGIGKVKVGQEVILKLDNYPFMEYGSIKGRVSSISLTSNTEKSDNNKAESYLLDIELPNQLTTNYGPQLEFKFEIKGTGDVITKPRRLLERFFDNLKYIIKG